MQFVDFLSVVAHSAPPRPPPTHVYTLEENSFSGMLKPWGIGLHPSEKIGNRVECRTVMEFPAEFGQGWQIVTVTLRLALPGRVTQRGLGEVPRPCTPQFFDSAVRMLPNEFNQCPVAVSGGITKAKTNSSQSRRVCATRFCLASQGQGFQYDSVLTDVGGGWGQFWGIGFGR